MPLRRLARRFLASTSAASLIGYTLVGGLVSIAAIGAMDRVGGETNSVLIDVRTSLAGAVEVAGGGAGPVSTGAPPAPTFTSHTFTTCGQSGPTGPSEAMCETA